MSITPAKHTFSIFAALLISVTSAFAQQQLFERYDLPPERAESAIFDAIQRKETTKRVRTVKVNTELFNNAELDINCFPDIALLMKKQRSTLPGTKLKTWSGADPSELASASFLINGERVSGHVTSVRGNFEVMPVGDSGLHVIVEHDITRFGGCATIDSPKPDVNIIQHHQGSRAPGDNECNIRVLVAYTDKAQDSVMQVFGRSMIEHVNLAILESNQGFANSQVDQRFELAYLYETGDHETADSEADVIALQDTADGKWDEIHMYRDMYQADLVCLVTGGTYENICGRAYGFDYTDPANMFQVTEFDCMVGNYTFAHEFGHTQGCRHDGDLNTEPFAQAHGYNQGSVFRTIMAVCCFPQRVNYWSNPYLWYPGAGPMGTLNFNYNAAALNTSDSIVAMHRITPMYANTTDEIGDDEMAYTRTVDMIDAADTVGSGALIKMKASQRIRLAPGFRALPGSKTEIRIEEGCSNN